MGMSGYLESDSPTAFPQPNFVIPQVAPGTYFITAVADVDGDVAEANESNNERSIAVTIIPGVCDLNSPHRRLLDESYPEIVFDTLDAFGDELQPLGYQLDWLSFGTPWANYDNYEITIPNNVLPVDFDPRAFVATWPMAMNLVPQGQGYDDMLDVHEFSTSPSPPDVADIIEIDIVGPDNGDIILTRAGDNWFRVATIDTGYAGTYAHGTHPVSGSREFGYVDDSPSGITFYTRAVDSPANTGSQTIGTRVQRQGWVGMMQGIGERFGMSTTDANLAVEDFQRELWEIPNCHIPPAIGSDQGPSLFDPDLQMVGGGLLIPDGDTSPIEQDDTDFGRVNLLDAAIVHTFTIENLGSGMAGPTTDSWVQIDGDADFSIVRQPEVDLLASGDSATFDVRFRPTVLGTREATVTVFTNDPDENPYDFRVRGHVDFDPISSGDLGGYWSFDEIGSGVITPTPGGIFDVQLTGSAVIAVNVPDVIGTGHSLMFGGTGRAEMTSTSDSLDSETFTMSYWVNRGGSPERGTLTARENENGHLGFATSISATGELVVTDNDDQPTLTGHLLPVDGWQHISWTYDGAQLGLYADGEHRGNFSLQLDPRGPLSLGGNEFDPSAGLVGSMDEVAIWNRVLDPDEIATIADNVITELYGQPSLQLDLHEVDFHDVEVGTTASREVTITNTGSAKLDISQAEVLLPLDGSDYSPFGILPVNGLGTVDDWVVLPGESRPFSITYSPTSLATHVGTALLASNDAQQATLFVSLSGVGIPVPGLVAYRDDDGTMESAASIDYTDDRMTKTIQLPVEATHAETARLWIYGQPYNFPNHDFASRDDYFVRVNGNSSQEVEFNVGELFGYLTETYDWASVDIPMEWLNEGDNRFFLSERFAPSGWLQNDLRVGIDTDSDVGRSSWYGNGLTCNTDAACQGELMIYLELVHPVDPELDVKTNGADGVEYHEFAATTVGTSVTQSFEIRNTGTADLVVFGISFDVPSSVFSIDTPMRAATEDASTIHPGESRSFDVTYAPTDAVDNSATVLIETNDDDEGTYRVDLSGQGAAPEIDACFDGVCDRNGVDLGEFVVGDVVRFQVDVRNNGTADLHLMDAVWLDPITPFSLEDELAPLPIVSPGEIILPVSENSTSMDGDWVVAPGESRTVVVAFAATSVGFHGNVLRLISNDADESFLELWFTAEVVAPDLDVWTEATGGNTHHYGFGNVTPGVTLSRQLVVKNEGNAELSLVDVSLENDNAAFNLTPSDDLPDSEESWAIAAGDSMAFTITFTPTTDEEYVNSVHLTSDDVDERNYEIQLWGRGIAEENDFCFAGDFDGDCSVGADDLNLVLFNWGRSTVPSSWVSQFPGSAVGSEQLNLVLFNWGSYIPDDEPESAGEVTFQTTSHHETVRRVESIKVAMTDGSIEEQAPRDEWSRGRRQSNVERRRHRARRPIVDDTSGEVPAQLGEKGGADTVPSVGEDLHVDHAVSREA